MSDGVTIGLIGDKEVIRKFQRLASRDVRRALANGTRAGAKVLQPIAKAKAPKEKGKLRRTIKVRATKRSRRFVGAVLTVRADAEKFYAPFLEWGTKYITGQLFMEKTAKQAWESATRRCNAIVKAHVEEAAKR